MRHVSNDKGTSDEGSSEGCGRVQVFANWTRQHHGRRGLRTVHGMVDLMTRINISITNEKTIERLQRLTKNMEISYADLVAIATSEFELLQNRRAKGT